VIDELLSYRGEHLWSNHGEERAWVFRGQFDAAWGLQPSVMRPGALSSFVACQAVPIPRDAITVQERLGFEHSMVLNFAVGADRAGYHLPGDTPQLRAEARTELGRPLRPTDFPEVAYRGLYALAQHYGVPTRLLDWTPRPFVAAYFSCVQAAEEHTSHKRRNTIPKRRSPRCAIWALSEESLAVVTADSDPAVATVTAPAALVPNLAAQAGRFTLVHYRAQNATADRFDPPNLDDLFRDRQVDEAHIRYAPVLYQFTYPATQSRRLLYLLSFLDVTASSIYPGQASVEQMMFERTLMVGPAYSRSD
jgi:hypothetical protein